MAPAARANLTTIASFPKHFFLENLAGTGRRLDPGVRS